MTIKSILPTPTASMGVALGTMALVYTIYNSNMPNAAVVRATDANDKNVESGRRKANFQAVAAVAAVSLLTKDVTIFTLGGFTTLALDFNARHSILTHPATGEIVSQSPATPPLAAVQ